MQIERWHKQMSVVIADSGDVSGEFDVGPAAGGQIKFPTGCTSPATWESEDSAGNWAAIHDSADAAESTAFTVDKWEPIPERVLLCAGPVRLTVGANVSGAKTVEIDLKG